MVNDSVPYSQLLCLPSGKKLAHGDSSGYSQVVVPLLSSFSICTVLCSTLQLQFSVLSYAWRLTWASSSFWLIDRVSGKGHRVTDIDAGDAGEVQTHCANPISSGVNDVGMILVDYVNGSPSWGDFQ